jgi:hypothetical protein
MMYFPTASEGDVLRLREENQQRNCGSVICAFTKSGDSAPLEDVFRYYILLLLSPSNECHILDRRGRTRV